MADDIILEVKPVNSTPLRIMILSNSLNAGGAERFASSMLEALPAANMQTHLSLLRSDISYPLPDSTPVHLLDYHGPPDLLKSVWRLRRLLHEIRPDVLLGVGTSVNVVAGLALAATRRRPAWIARVDTNLDRRDLWLRRRILGRLHRLADCIVANSEGMRRQLTAAFPGLKAKIVVRHNPVAFHRFEAMAGDTPVWRPPDQRPLIVTAGRAHPAKRWDILLDAFAKVVEDHDAALALCGNGPQMQTLQAQADGLGLGRRIHFLGHCDNPFAVMALADMFVLSSEAEGLPNTLIEAQGLGLCAVATRCPFGPDEIVTHGQTGLLTAVNDSHAMAGAIVSLLSDEDLRQRMGIKAREKVRRQFDFAERSREWEILIRRVAAGRGVAAGGI